MTAPNLLQLTSVLGKSTGLRASTTSQNILVNANNSNKLLKVGTVVAGNKFGNTATISVQLSKANTVFRFADTISVPANSTIVITAKDTSLYLEENDKLIVSSDTNLALDVIVSYEELQ